MNDYRATARALYEIDTQWYAPADVPTWEDLGRGTRMEYLKKAAFVVGCQEIARASG